ncbi:MAG: orotidine 5'-phosphate decarboxylase / HUMPS family protein [Candidatus Heimdallarchaeaceae archaeon]
MSQLIERYREISERKNSLLCISLDPALPSQRSRNVMADDDRVSFMKKLISEVAPFCCAIKLNRQYLIGLTADEIRSINIAIHQNDMISIIDHKLGDIDTSNESAIFWFKEESFDAFTFSPFSANIDKASLLARQKNLGIIVITLLSNPESMFYKIATISEKPLFLYVAEKCKNAQVDGFWIGNADHIDVKDVRKLKDITGSKILAVSPIYGKEHLIVKSIIYHYDVNSLICVGGPIVYSSDPHQKAEEYKNILNQYKLEMRERKTLKDNS